jgi:thiol-disulfide isomerase/thioredoxin
MMLDLLMLLPLAHAVDAPGALLLDVPGANDDCCAQKVASVLAGLPFVASAGASFDEQRACIVAREGSVLDEAAVRAALEAAGYPVKATQPVDACPPHLVPRREPWDAYPDVDAKVVSRGEAVRLQDLRVPDGFTVVDFGAPWCGPCFTVAGELATYLRGHPDTHVRVVWLDAKDAVASFALPAAQEHLRFAAALPWFVVIDPRGKRIHEGGDAAEAMRAIDKARGKRR